ncbi:hypothetical protein BGX27_006568 [Mortierella sp. AM989]|nr:hypothetical protein BGX27_006568 [Mortierella sp. AM989]
MSKSWDEILERESQQRQFEQLMEQRKIDLRRQNVHQLRIDGDAMTRELDEVLREPNQKLDRPKRPSAEVATEQESASAPDQERPTKKYIDHLVGPGTTSSRLNTSSRLIVEEIDVSEALLNACRDNLKKSEIANESDLLTINFIFDVNFLRKHLPTATTESLLNVIVLKPTTSAITLFMDFSIFAATHPYQEAKRHLRNRIQGKEDCIVTAVPLSYTERPDLWKQVSSHPASLPSLPQNEDAYIQSVVKSIIFGIVGDLDVVDHWSRDPLPTPYGFEELYFPDYFAEFDNLPLFVVEIKKPGAMDDDLEGDQRKLSCMMKLVLDTILDAGVLASSVIGLLIRGSRCEASSISLDNEALYIHKLIGVFELPKNNLQFGLLCPAIGPLKFARPTAWDTYKPDATLINDDFKLGNVEVKLPKEERHQKLYLEDVWALTGLFKGNIDLHLRHGRIISTER